ncbi:MAG: hypothetical protein ABW077_08340 [Candidatus Thiodiazotropha endolucinida]
MPKISSKVVVGIILVIVTVYYLPVIIQHIEQPHRKFHLYDSNMFVGNWIPDIFPKDVTNIHEQHDIDTNEVWVRLDANEMPFLEAMSNTQLVYGSELEISALSKPMYAKWWFSSLEPNASIYKGECNKGMVSYFFISGENKAYWWCQYEL